MKNVESFMFEIGRKFSKKERRKEAISTIFLDFRYPRKIFQGAKFIVSFIFGFVKASAENWA